jgi:Xaa-Pro aminopeptidase
MVKLIIDSPQKNSDLIYGSGYYCLDPFIFLEIDDKKYGWLPSTELERAKKKSKLNEIFNLNFDFLKLRKTNTYPLLNSSLLIDFFRNNNITEIDVPYSFPIAEANNLTDFGFKLIPQMDPFYKNRVSKTPEEINYIRENSKLNVQVMNEVKNIIAESSITNDKKLKYKGEILTSEFLQNFIFKSFLDKGLISDSVIVAIGDQGCDPHENGSGEVFANTSIIVDIFPKSRSNFYFTDMTRTFCKGKASNELKKMYESVHEAQKYVFDKIKPDVYGKDIHSGVVKYFENKGFKSGIINNILQGYFHGTGHGLGLDCHEKPYINTTGGELPENSIISNEPGLYYLGIGGVRIEDLLLITKNGFENLTNYEKILELE